MTSQSVGLSHTFRLPLGGGVTQISAASIDRPRGEPSARVVKMANLRVPGLSSFDGHEPLCIP